MGNLCPPFCGYSALYSVYSLVSKLKEAVAIFYFHFCDQQQKKYYRERRIVQDGWWATSPRNGNTKANSTSNCMSHTTLQSLEP